MKKVILTSMLFISSVCICETLTSAALLNKISQSTRGQPADVTDLKKINNLVSEIEKRQFIELKTDQYLTTQEYSNKMSLRLIELFQFKAAINLKQIQKNSTINFFDQMTKNNLTWDALLTGKKYTLNTQFVSLDLNPPPDDVGFFGMLTSLPASDNGYIKSINSVENIPTPTLEVSFAETEPQIAGAVTTPLFFERYGTTGLNKNRRRAAAMFRIFLCDKMKASIPAEAHIDEATYNILYPNEQPQINSNTANGMTQEEIKKILNKSDDIHGTRADCMSCHSKLDPMGKVFSNSGSLLSSVPSSGRLYYKSSVGQIIDQPVDNLNQMGQVIIQQNEYVTCQIKQFWNWYIGEDLVVDSVKMDQLKTEFNRVGRKTNDFVKSLVLSSEFAERKAHNEIRDLAVNVKKYFQQCQGCHNADSMYSGTDLTKWPLGNPNSPRDNPEFWLKKITKVLDLDHGGLKRSMPPKVQDGGFIPSKQELEMVQKWIQLGGPDELGQVQVPK
jgi:hypothetical protein